MKLNEARPYLESAGELEEQFFGIQDQGMLFDILRKKVYSNPILAICREISCNARDAHREVGIPEIPIHIHLPNNLKPYYQIKDFGPGISSERMSNVFIKYTASTKRSDNVQTGGFGLGAKTPFSYTDSFSIITIHNGVKYNYNCVIDETRVGKLILTSQEHTTEKNGTEIMIPVLSRNFMDFCVYTEQACRHWDIKPIISGGEIEWKIPEISLSGNKWAVAPSDGNKEAKVIVDGIEYPLDLTALKNYADIQLVSAVKGQLIMYFGVGELSLSVSREQVYLDEKTQGIIRDRLKFIGQEIRQRAIEKIHAIPNLWEANIYFNTELRATFNNTDFLNPLEWKGFKLIKNHFSTNTTSYCFTKGKYSYKYGLDPNRLSRSSDYYVRFDKHTALYYNDLPIKDPTPRHVKKAFDDDPNLTKIYVICPSDKITKDDLFKAFNLEAMKIKFLSSITKATARAYTPPATRLLVFKFDSRASAFRQVSYASIDEDKSTKILCVLKRRVDNGIRWAILKNKHELSYSSLRALMTKFPKHSFYGVDETASPDRIKEDFSDFIDVESFIKNNVFGIQNIDYVKIKFANHNQYVVDAKLVKVHKEMAPLIKNVNSLYLQCLNLQKTLKEMVSKDVEMLNLYETFNGVIEESHFKKFLKENPQLDIKKMNTSFTQKYPLLEHINSWDYHDLRHYLAEYINLIDKEK